MVDLILDRPSACTAKENFTHTLSPFRFLPAKRLLVLRFRLPSLGAGAGAGAATGSPAPAAIMHRTCQATASSRSSVLCHDPWWVPSCSWVCRQDQPIYLAGARNAARMMTATPREKPAATTTQKAARLGLWWAVFTHHATHCAGTEATKKHARGRINTWRVPCTPSTATWAEPDSSAARALCRVPVGRYNKSPARTSCCQQKRSNQQKW